MKNFLGLVVLIGLDNNMKMRPLEECKFCDDSGIDWQKLDSDAAKLSIPEAEAFCNGEQGESILIERKHDLGMLHSVLNEVFDGYLHDHFFYPWP